MKLFLVDTVSSHRVSYVVRCKSEEHAMDTVTMDEAEEFSQVHLGENISRVTEITEEQYLTLFDKDNEYLQSWSDEQKKNLITEVNYDDEGKYNPISNSMISL